MIMLKLLRLTRSTLLLCSLWKKQYKLVDGYGYVQHHVIDWFRMALIVAGILYGIAAIRGAFQ